MAIGFKRFTRGRDEHVPARRRVEQLISESNFTNQAFSFTKIYASWETDEIIGFELWRNVGLALICVFFIILTLIANFKICFLVLSCVSMTLIDVVGFLHFWNINIDTISCINIILAIGLCVDYAAHIAHAFMVNVGTRNQRAKTILVNMGPAILNGGLSTFIAFLLLGFSTSHVFVTFFKVFFLTVVFGLFHGLIFLPVILSIVGPPPYPSEKLEAQAKINKKASVPTVEDINHNSSSALKSGQDNPVFISDKEGSTISTLFRPMALPFPRNKRSWDVPHVSEKPVLRAIHTVDLIDTADLERRGKVGCNNNNSNGYPSMESRGEGSEDSDKISTAESSFSQVEFSERL